MEGKKKKTRNKKVSVYISLKGGGENVQVLNIV